MNPPDVDDHSMTGFIGLADYKAEVTIIERRLTPLPEGANSAQIELVGQVNTGKRQHFQRWTEVDDKPQAIRETWVAWVREAEALAVPPAILSVDVYSHRVDWHTDAPMILVFVSEQRRYYLAE